MKSTFFLIAGLFAIPRCMAYMDAEMYDRTNLWYGSESNFDEVWADIMASMQPPSNVLMEIRAFQATNRIPVLAEVMASNRAYAIEHGLDTSVITWSDAEYRSLSTPPPLEEGETRDHQSGRHLMALMGVPHGDELAICTNWTMPTNVLVGGVSYSVVTDFFAKIHVTSPTNALEKFARGYLDRCINGKEARIHGFAQRMAAVTHATAVGHALNLSVKILDPATNLMFLCSNVEGKGDMRDVLIYKNLVLHMYSMANAPTNALDFAVAILNAGLPETERIVLSLGE